VIKQMREDAQTTVIMITGDGPGTAHRIALESGIIIDEKESVYTGDEIDQSTDGHLLDIMKNGQARIFARVTPEHKLRLATILQDAGEVVAMTGDGVNDAPALQKATIGISLSSSTEVAKEAADLVLIDDSFDTIAYAIKEGRRLIGNLKKTIIYLLSTSLSIVFVIIASLILAGPVPFYPTQILWANIIEEGLMNFAFIFEPAERHVRKRKYGQSMVGRHTRNMIIGIGIANGLILLAFYLLLMQQNISDELLRTYMFAALSIDNVFFGVALKSLYDPIWRVKLFSNMYLIYASLFSFVLLLLALELPFLRKVLHLEELTWSGLAIVLCFGIINLLAVEIVKKLCRTA
jgi:Ca2+-transporting ATPase